MRLAQSKCTEMSLVQGLIATIRNEFPRADSDASGRRRIFFDAGAGSLVLRRAAQAQSEAMINYSANLGAPSWESQKAGEAIYAGRSAIKDFLNAESEECIVSGESATTLFFRLMYAISKELKRDQNVVTTEYDHYANVSACLELQRRGVVKETRLVKFNPETGSLDLDDLAASIDSETAIVSVAGVSNGLGSKTPLEKVRKLAREVGAYFVVDGVHMAPHMPTDVQEIDCDFLIFSGYKVFSRRGSFMYGKGELLEKLSPYKVDPAPDKVPTKWESGTLDQSLFASFNAVVDYFLWLGEIVQDQYKQQLQGLSGRKKLIRSAMLWIQDYEQTLSKAMLSGTGGASGIVDIPNVELYGIRDASRVKERTPTFTFSISGASYLDVAQYLWQKHSVATLPDDFYSRALKTYGIEKAVRASLAHYNTLEEVETFLRALLDTSQKLRTPT